MKKSTLFIICILLLISQGSKAQQSDRPQTPVMGWSSWNNFHVNISEEIIKAQADRMVSSGLNEAGYKYINIDDGYFGGRDEKGKLLVHPKRFPNGMKSLATYIHSKGLMAGIYSDGGINTCASQWDKDSIGIGCGLYGHDREDLALMLKEWNYDFIKIDWCGGLSLGLDEQTRYTELGTLIRSIRPNVVYNVCRWQFPGKWVVQVADSWRISGDISNKFESILKIIDLNADLWMYSSSGHVNDMDMLQVGRGMTYDEDKSHFTMWCMMNSPLLLGNDLRTMSKQTLGIVGNREVIALNQDPLVYQARRLMKEADMELWAKPLISVNSGKIAVALLNRSDKPATMSFELKTIGIDAAKGYVVRDLWEKKDSDKATSEKITMTVPSHGVAVLKITGKSIPFNVFQKGKI
jgi:alpha-galactosidase